MENFFPPFLQVGFYGGFWNFPFTTSQKIAGSDESECGRRYFIAYFMGDHEGAGRGNGNIDFSCAAGSGRGEGMDAA